MCSRLGGREGERVGCAVDWEGGRVGCAVDREGEREGGGGAW